MKVKVSVEQEIDIKSLAQAVVNAEPAEFRQLWVEMFKLMSNREMRAFAEALASSMGIEAKKKLKQMIRLIDYYEVKAERDAVASLIGDCGKSSSTQELSKWFEQKEQK